MPDESRGTGTERGSYWQRLRHQKQQILNVRAEAARKRTGVERVIRSAARIISHPFFFVSELVFHVAWIALNTAALPPHLRWDPYPFPLLAGAASIQALFIGLLILMYEEHSAMIADTREETELQVSLHTERETTKLLRMMAEVQRALGIPTQEHDDELAEMAQPLDPGRLHQATEHELREVEEG